MTECPQCGCEEFTIHAMREDVPYGSEGKTVSVIVPFINCHECGGTFTDVHAEVIRDFAVKEASDS
jgi:C4-type Zn-finger protein